MDLIQQGFLLLVVGLAAVLLFLSMVIGWIYLSSLVIRRFNFDKALTGDVVSGGGSVSPADEKENERIMAVISAAVRKYREDRSRPR